MMDRSELILLDRKQYQNGQYTMSFRKKKFEILIQKMYFVNLKIIRILI